MLGTNRLKQFFQHKFNLKRWFSSKLTLRSWLIIVIGLGISGIVWLNWGRIYTLYQQASGADPVAFFRFDEGAGNFALDSVNTNKGYLSATANNFASRVDYASGTSPYSVIMVDFNNDGKDDLATSHGSSTYVSVFINNGDGTFATRVNYALVTASLSLASGDFNQDGYNDIVAVNTNSPYGISILMNDGDGTFATKVDYASEVQPYGVAVDDINGDGFPDLATVNFTSPNNISTYINNGDGTFATRINYPISSTAYPLDITLGDLNGDDRADIISADQNDAMAISVRMNNGDGTFASTVNYTAGGGQPSALSVGDINNDGHNDILFGRASNLVGIYFNNGDGTFTTLITATVGTAPESVKGADINRDGFLDIVAANRSSNTISVLINNGNSTFATKVDYAAPTTARSVSIGDVNGDNMDDIAVVGDGSQITSVFINRGTPPRWQTEEKCITEKCIHFDGTDDYISLDEIDLNDEFTFSAWIKTTQQTTGMIVVRGNIANNAGVYMTLSSTDPGYLLAGGNNGGGWNAARISNTYVTDNKWHHVAVVYDQSANSATGFVDGVQGLTQSITFDGTSYSPYNTKIGRNQVSTSQFFAGFIDEVKIYDYARSAEQIKTDYAGGSYSGSSVVLGLEDQGYLSDGLVGYWKMDEIGDSGSNWTAVDSSGNNNVGTGAGNASVGSTAPGKFGNAGYFDNNGDYVSIPDADILDINDGNSFTLSAWVKSPLSDNNVIFAKKQGNSSNQQGYMLYTNSSGQIAAYISDGTNQINKFTDSTISANTWSHIVMVYKDNDSLTMYINGQDGGGSISGTISAVGSLSNSLVLAIGAESDAGLPMLGSIDDARIYNRSLNLSEIQDLYNWAPGPIGYWKFDEGVGSDAIDSSGFSNNGILATGNSSPVWTSGKFGNGLLFDGTNDYVGIGDTLLRPSQLSVSMWFKTNSTTGANLLRKRTFGYGIQMGSVIANTAPSAGQVTFFIYDSGPTLYQAKSTATYNDNKWHHVEGTYNGSTVSLYIDGIFITSTAAGVIHYGSGAIGIGRDGDSNSNFFNGVIDDVKIYNYPRTQGQIVQDMNAGHPAPGSPVGSAALHYRFDEGYGTGVNNAGNAGSTLNGNFLSGTASPIWSNDGKFGKALSFDGTQDGVDLPSNSALFFSNSDSFTISTWVQAQPSMVVAGQIFSQQMCSPGIVQLYINTTGLPSFRIADTGSIQGYTHGTKAINDSTWHHLVGVRDVAQDKTLLYIDGMLNVQSTDPTIANLSASSTVSRIGNRYWCGDFGEFKGKIDEFKIYRSAFDADQVKVEYNQGKAIVLGAGSTGVGGTSPSNSASREYCVPGDTSECLAPVGEWKMDEGSGTTIYSTSGTANGVMGNFNGRFGRTQGKIGGGILFDGTDDRIEIASSGPIGTDTTFAISAWVNPSANYSNNGVVYCECSIGGATRNGFFVIGNGVVRLDQYEPSGGAMDSNATIPFGEWSHIAYSRNGSTQYLYINGVLDKTNTSVENFSGAILGQPSKTTIGVRYDNSGDNYSLEFNGKIDQVRAYNYYRTPAQIAWEYNQGEPVAWYRMDEGTGGTVYNVVKNANGKPSGNNGTVTIGGSGTQTTTTAAWTNGASGRFNGSLNLDGVDDYITIADDDKFSFGDGTTDRPFSLAAWVKMDDNIQNVIVGKYDQTTGNQQREWLFYTSSSGYLTMEVNDETVGGYISRRWAVDFPEGSWHYVTATYDGSHAHTGIRIYVDGIRKDDTNTSNGTYTAVRNTTSSVLMGRDISSGGGISYPFEGQIDEVKIFNFELTPEQIKTNMAGGAVRFQ